jgi:hypothetical protein
LTLLLLLFSSLTDVWQAEEMLPSGGWEEKSAGEAGKMFITRYERAKAEQK